MNSFSSVPRASVFVFKFCSSRLIFGGTEGVRSHFHVLRFRVIFVSRAPGPVFMFCAPRPVLAGTESVWSYFLILRSQTRFWRYRGCQVLFSCFPLPDPFWAVMRVSGPVFMFCALGLIFGGTLGVGPFSCFALPDSFWVVSRAPDLVFIFCTHGLILCGIVGAGSSFHVLRSRTCFGRYRVCWVSFACLVLPYSFSVVPWAPGPFFKFCAPRPVLGGTEGVRSRFYVLRSLTHFRRYIVCRVLFYYFAIPNEIVLGGTEGDESHFHILRSRTNFGWYRGGGSSYQVLRSSTRFGLYRGRRVLFGVQIFIAFPGEGPETGNHIPLRIFF
jgi:hypothetical protein